MEQRIGGVRLTTVRPKCEHVEFESHPTVSRYLVTFEAFAVRKSYTRHSAHFPHTFGKNKAPISDPWWDSRLRRYVSSDEATNKRCLCYK